MYDTAPTLTTQLRVRDSPILFQVLCDHVLSKKTRDIKPMLAE